MTASSQHAIPAAPARPPRRYTLLEPMRASFELASGLAKVASTMRTTSTEGANPVLTLPGYGGADGSMAGIRAYLKRAGYRTYKLGLGRNLDRGADRIRSVDDATRFRQRMVDATVERVEELYAHSQQAITLVGWSLGGVYAVDVAQRIPHKVHHVVTLGSPFGDPRGTALFNTMRIINRSTVPLEAQDFHGWNKQQQLRETSVPISVIFSPSDGIVSEDIARLRNDQHVRYVPVDSSHIGFAFNPGALQALADELELHAGQSVFTLT